MFNRTLRLVAMGVLGLAMLLTPVTPVHAEGPPILTLPTPRGETWEVIQGYNCGTHDGWGRLSFDIVNHDGRTSGAPVHAAADGTIMYWGPQSGTLILRHGGGYFTMYTHMQTRIDAPVGTWVARGTQVGTVGAVNPTPTIPHLHFTFFYGDGPYGNNRRPLPLSFADGDGYDFPNTGRCNEHAGALLVADGEPIVEDEVAPTVTFSGAPEATWTNDARVDWIVEDDQAVAGFSQSWDDHIHDEVPDFDPATEGFLDLEAHQGGVHTLYVKAWDKAGNVTEASREVWFDPDAPVLPVPQPASADAAVETESTHNHSISASAADSLTLSWEPAQDDLSGVSGYQIYFGADPEGMSDWFVAEPQVGLDPVSPGVYYLRVRAQDNAHNFSEWVTVSTYEVAEDGEAEPEAAPEAEAEPVTDSKSTSTYSSKAKSSLGLSTKQTQ